MLAWREAATDSELEAGVVVCSNVAVAKSESHFEGSDALPGEVSCLVLGGEDGEVGGAGSFVEDGDGVSKLG